MAPVRHFLLLIRRFAMASFLPFTFGTTQIVLNFATTERFAFITSMQVCFPRQSPSHRTNLDRRPGLAVKRTTVPSAKRAEQTTPQSMAVGLLVTVPAPSRLLRTTRVLAGLVRTSTGVELSLVVPSPSRPYSLWPQHFTVPAFVRAHVCSRPAEIAETPVESPKAATGVERSVVVPSPSCPYWLLPQHFTPPLLMSAQVCVPPVAIAETPLESPETPMGVEW